MSKNHRLAIIFLVAIWGCKNSTSPSDSNSNTTTLSGSKPPLGASFTMEATITDSGAVTSDTTFTYIVADTNATHDGRSGVVAMQGYYFPFWVAYATNGDIYVWGNSDFIAGRNAWTWYPVSMAAGQKAETYSQDTIISDPNPNDTRQIVKDTFEVIGNGTSTINGQAVSCIKGLWVETFTLKSLQYGFTISNSDSARYSYAPSLHYWTKEQSGLGPSQFTFQMKTYTP